MILFRILQLNYAIRSQWILYKACGSESALLYQGIQVNNLLGPPYQGFQESWTRQASLAYSLVENMVTNTVTSVDQPPARISDFGYGNLDIEGLSNGNFPPL
jgi:hypothetical protein